MLWPALIHTETPPADRIGHPISRKDLCEPHAGPII